MATVDTLLSDVVLPYLRELGERWERGDASIAQEHFASSVLRGRLLGLARGWGLGVGPAAVLACLPGEQHDLGLIAFGLALRARGWRIVYLGTDTPIETVEEVSRRLDPSLVVLNAVTGERVRPARHQLRALAGRHRLALGGAGARERRPGVQRRARAHRRPDRRSHECHDARPGRRSAMAADSGGLRRGEGRPSAGV